MSHTRPLAVLLASLQEDEHTIDTGIAAELSDAWSTATPAQRLRLVRDLERRVEGEARASAPVVDRAGLLRALHSAGLPCDLGAEVDRFRSAFVDDDVPDSGEYIERIGQDPDASPPVLLISDPVCVGIADPEDHVGWYWRACMPGCLPDSDYTGPFSTREEALDDVVSDTESEEAAEYMLGRTEITHFDLDEVETWRPTDGDHPMGEGFSSSHAWVWESDGAEIHGDADEDGNPDDEVTQLLRDAVQENLCAVPFAWTRGYLTRHSGAVGALLDAGFTVWDVDDGYLFGVDGGGYDFASAHWLPLMLAMWFGPDREDQAIPWDEARGVPFVRLATDAVPATHTVRGYDIVPLVEPTVDGEPVGRLDTPPVDEEG